MDRLQLFPVINGIIIRLLSFAVRNARDGYIRFMRRFRIALMMSAFFCVMVSDAQLVSATLNIKVYDSYTNKPLAGVSIIDPKSSITRGTNGRGEVSFITAKSDTLFLFYPGYRTAKFSVADSADKSEYQLKLFMEPLSTGLNQSVIIKAPKTLEDIEKERKKLGTTPKELDRPIIAPFTSPISALYEILSNRAQEREKLKKQIKEDDRRKIFKELLNYYNENGLIDLPESNYEDFIDFCNLPIDFLKYNSDYEITKTVIELYNKYGRLNGLIK